jgi:hypothetical protein
MGLAQPNSSRILMVALQASKKQCNCLDLQRPIDAISTLEKRSHPKVLVFLYYRDNLVQILPKVRYHNAPISGLEVVIPEVMLEI